MTTTSEPISRIRRCASGSRKRSAVSHTATMRLANAATATSAIPRSTDERMKSPTRLLRCCSMRMAERVAKNSQRSARTTWGERMCRVCRGLMTIWFVAERRDQLPGFATMHQTAKSSGTVAIQPVMFQR